MHASTRSAFRCEPTPRAFTLVELLIVIGIIAVLIGILVPTLNKARASSNSLKCATNIRNMEIAHTMYMTANQGVLIRAGLAHSSVPGSHDPEVSWLKTLQEFYTTPLAHRCPVDVSLFWDQPLPGSNPPMFRGTSFGINNYVDPGHAPANVGPYETIHQIKNPSAVIHFVEIVENGNYATSDHIHVENFYNILGPNKVPALAGNQLALGRHGGKPKDWGGVANYGFLDGHVETLPLRSVYQDRSINKFDPAVAK